MDDSSILYLFYIIDLRCFSGMIGWERREVLKKNIQNYEFSVFEFWTDPRCMSVGGRVLVKSVFAK